ncbi:MAG: hypothetical protein E7632_14105, partial [Ruminococcaceae bacterium]|nr:hypothetical protein [Oscillospiraceae bacterium]
MLNNLKLDRPFIERKYHDPDKPFNAFNRMAYHGWECDPATGYDDAQMRTALGEYVSGLTDTSHAVIKAKAFAFVLDHMRFIVDEHDWFPCFYNWNRPLNEFTLHPWLGQLYGKDSPVPAHLMEFRRDYVASGDIQIWLDCDHSLPDWHALYELGFPGIMARAEEYRAARKTSDERETAYFDSIAICYAAILRLIGRVADYARSCTFKKAQTIARCLDNLRSGAPTDTYERLMLIYIYFMMSESVDSFQVRSLGSGLDYDLTAPYRADLASGRWSEGELDEFIGCFLLQYQAIGNYWGQPMYISGSNLDGSCKANEITQRILEIYDELALYNPKIQVKYAPNTPDWLLDQVCDMIRRGHSSFVFCCEDNMVKNYLDRGIPLEDCYDYDVKGCYESVLRGKEVSTGAGYINPLGSVVRALNASDDTDTYESFEAKFYDSLRYVIESTMAIATLEEPRLSEVNPAPLLSATYRTSLEKARDGYCDGADRNTSSLCITTFASAIDSLCAVRQLVFEEGRVTMTELKRILAENWSDAALRRRALTSAHKYGTGDPMADACTKKLADFLASFQDRGNNRNGIFKMELHSARQFIEQAAKLPATPDGRLAGEEMSKNGSPVMGMDRNGVTALIRSALNAGPGRFTEGFGFDVMLHPTAVQGDDGLAAMRALLRAYDVGGGGTIQFNITDSATLRD